MIELGVLKNFDAGTYRAGVQLAGSLTTYFDDVSVARNIPAAAMVVGNYVIVATLGGNPKDACVIATWPQGSAGGGGMEQHGNEYHDPDFEEEGIAAALVEAHRTTATHAQPQPPVVHANDKHDPPFLDVTAAAVSLYVDDSLGGDENDGSSGSPTKTIQGALDALPVAIAHAATINVRPGSYPENNAQLDFSRFDTLTTITIRAVNAAGEPMYDQGKATGGGSNYLDDSGGGWSVNQFQGAYIWIYQGTGAGQIRQIASNTSTRITVSSAWTTPPDSTSYYTIGGGVTMTGTGQYHVMVDGKKVNIYGLCHTGATVYDISIRSGAVGGVMYNYFAGLRGIQGFNPCTVNAYYNYYASTSAGIIALGFVMLTARGSVHSYETYGLDIERMSCGIPTGIAGQKNYFDHCTTGIRLLSASGCEGATVQVYTGCGTDYSADASSWYT